MNMSLTRILLKIFAYRFYREHSGLLFFFFVTILNYCFFIKTAGVYRAEESVFYHLMLIMSFIVTPVIMIVVLAMWLLYTIKSWQYVSRQLSQEQNQFLFYSMTSYSKFDQLKSWFCVQMVISLPLIGYWFLAMVLGLVYHAYLIPLITLVFIMLLALASAMLYVFLVNRISKTPGISFLMRISRAWQKPYASLFIYHLLNRLKLAFILTKIFSFLILTGLLALFVEDQSNIRIPAMIVLGIATLHSFLIYKEHEFKEVYLGFSRNLPFNRIKLFFTFPIIYLIMVLPETLWLFTKFPIKTALTMTLLGCSIAMLFRSLVYLTGLKIYRYLLQIFGLFIVLFYTIMFGHFLILTFFSLIVAFLIFWLNYYKAQADIRY